MKSNPDNYWRNAHTIIKRKPSRVGIISFPMSAAGVLPLSNLIDVVGYFCRYPFIITGKAGYSFFKDNKQLYLLNVQHKDPRNQILRIPNYVWTQTKIAIEIIKIRRNVTILIFFIGSGGLLIPMLAAKLMRKPIVTAFTGSLKNSSKAQKDVFSGFAAQLENITCYLSDKIVLYSGNLIKEYGLEKQKHKISIACNLFLNLEQFKLTNEFLSREKTVGYIGRLSEEKGVMNFVKAIPMILETRPDLKFMIGGDGELQENISKYIKSNNLNENVDLIGWIPHNNLSDYLNKLKLLVVPSYTEAGPIIAFEAMACGTPVLGSKVGMMSQLLHDRQNGFVLENNSSELIAKKVLEIFAINDLDKISLNARKSAENLTFKSAVKAYKSVLAGFNMKVALQK